MAKVNAINNRAATFTSDAGITATTGNLTATLGDVVVTNGYIVLQASKGNDGDVLTSKGNAVIPVWQAPAASGFTWAAAGADASLVNGNGVINTKAALLTMTLPVTAAVGTIIAVQGSAAGATGWKIAQNAGQNIWLQATSSTIGVGGSLASTAVSDGVTLICTVADTTWNSIAVGGNITVV
jgi:hypothetical protein